MNSLKEIKEKVAIVRGYESWESYAAQNPISSTDELAKECFMEGQKERLMITELED